MAFAPIVLTAGHMAFKDRRVHQRQTLPFPIFDIVLPVSIPKIDETVFNLKSESGGTEFRG
ncbi:hypothetical protein [Mesorhizobium carmichaelinearum]|uniref:hypothetical protein n=1 Tax=Mesorhizobium carmichaelinearum TaxID=1208188 RepID=UPI0011803F68|nr:hypothetical protein [Mesorhizobium carmichaelinearum]